MNRLAARIFVPLIAAALGQNVLAGDRPNIVFILADDLGYGDLSSYGAPDIETPNIDRIASDGARFTQFFANSSVCSPTRAALMTGRYSELVGVPGVTRPHRPHNDWGYLDPNATTLPELLQEGGYDTALVGKWHLGLSSPNLPLERGFDHYQGWLSGMMDYYEHTHLGHNFLRDGSDPIDPDGHATDLFTDWAVDFLQSRSGDEDPFFLYLAYTAPHNPMQPRPDYLERARERIEARRADAPADAGPHWPLVFNNEVTEEDRLKLIGLVEHLDDAVGRVVATLEDMEILDDTIVFFASDNGGLESDGGWNGNVLRSGKGTMYGGGINVALVARAPGIVSPGTTVESRWAMMDVAPTLLELVGLPVPEDMDGVSFATSLADPEVPAPERDLFFVRREGGIQNYLGETRPIMFGGIMRAVLRGPWKLVLPSPFAAAELYNVEVDPGETENVIADHPGIVRELGDSLQLHVGEAGKVPFRRPDIFVDEFQ